MKVINCFVTAISVILNALTVTGLRYETLSARCWRSRSNPVFGALRKVIDTAFFWQTNHCQETYNLEKSMGIQR